LQSVFAGRVYGVAFGKTADEVWVLHADGVTLLDWRANKTIAKIPFSGAADSQASVTMPLRIERSSA